MVAEGKLCTAGVQQHASALEELAAAAARRAAAAEEDATRRVEAVQAAGYARLARIAAGEEERVTLRRA